MNIQVEDMLMQIAAHVLFHKSGFYVIKLGHLFILNSFQMPIVISMVVHHSNSKSVYFLMSGLSSKMRTKLWATLNRSRFVITSDSVGIGFLLEWFMITRAVLSNDK